MFVRYVFLIAAMACGNLYAAAPADKSKGKYKYKVDKWLMPLRLYNFTDYDMDFVYARTDPMNHVLPSMQLSIPAKHMADVNIRCLSGLLLIPELRSMLDIELVRALKERSFALKKRGGHAYIRIDSISRFDPLYGEKEFKVTSYLQLRDEHYEVDRYTPDVMLLATPDQIRDTIIDRCKAYLPASEGSYILGKRKYLRRSAG